MTNETDRSYAVTLKELREHFYRCRDLEIKNLWQRSLFLATFMVMCFSSYGKIMNMLLAPGGDEKTAVLHTIAICLGVIGLLFSILWIMMAKGSKAWYEVYENSLENLDASNELKIEEKYRSGHIDPGKIIDANILSCHAGKYSPSKINIAIGQILFFVWIIVILVHFFCNIIGMTCFMQACDAIQVFLIIINILLLLSAIIIPLILLCSRWVRSGSLK
jgi:hypothetical protein